MFSLINSVVNMALPAFAAKCRRPGCGKAAPALAPLQQNRQTDGRTPDHCIDPARHCYAGGANKNI